MAGWGLKYRFCTIGVAPSVQGAFFRDGRVKGPIAAFAGETTFAMGIAASLANQNFHQFD